MGSVKLGLGREDEAHVDCAYPDFSRRRRGRRLARRTSVVRGRGFGIIGDIVLGVIGSFIGAYLFKHVLHLTIGGLAGEFAAAVVGSQPAPGSDPGG